MRQYPRRVRVEIEDSDRAALIVEEMRVVFDLRSENQSSPTPSTIKIYNLGKASASHIAEPGQVVRLYAGYGDISDSDALAVSKILRVLHERSGLDRITTIVLDGSDSATRGAVISLEIPGTVGLREVVESVVEEMGLGVDQEALNAVPDEELEEGYSFNGAAKTALTKLLEPRGLTSYVVDGVVYFARPGQSFVRADFLLTERTGMIGSPSATENEGARAKMALNGSIVLDQLVEIRSEALDGLFKVTSVAHLGDTWGGEFVTEFEGQRVEQTLVGRYLVSDFTRGIA